MSLIAISFVATSVLFGQTGGGAPRVAVVNIPVVSEQYRKTAELEAEFEEMRKTLSSERDALKDRIDRISLSLKEELKPGSEAYRARRRELAMLQAEMEWFIETESARVERGLAESLREIFNDIRGAVHVVAESRGLDLVLASDQLPEATADSPGQMRQQIMLQKVLYWHPRVDITDEVVARLNADYDRESAAVADPPAVQRPKQ